MNNIHTVSLILNIGQRHRARKARRLSIDFSDGQSSPTQCQKPRRPERRAPEASENGSLLVERRRVQKQPWWRIALLLCSGRSEQNVRFRGSI
jgi:hypothetical protein